MAINPQSLIEKFKYALDNDWGYIWGTAGEKWTEADQRKATRQQTIEYGAKWIGHYVADCSGLFSWAFKQLGGYMYHGSNTMYKSYCTAKGTFSGGKRTDGNELLPGTALFTGTEANHGHVGLYIGDGYVIEARGTQTGVVKTKATDKRWTFWGELKGVDYAQQESGSDQKQHQTLRKGDKGNVVQGLQTLLISLGYSCGSSGADGDFGSATEKAVKKFQKDHGLTADGVVGKKTWAALDEENIPSPLVQYTVTIPRLSQSEAESLVSKYAGATMKEVK